MQLAQQHSAAANQGSFGEFVFGPSQQTMSRRSLADRRAMNASDFEQMLEQSQIQSRDLLEKRVRAGMRMTQDMLPGGGFSPETRNAMATGLAEKLGSPDVSTQDAVASQIRASEYGEYLQALELRNFTPEQAQGLISQQNTKFLQRVQSGVEVMDAYQQIIGALDSGNALGAQAAVIKLAKILDPTSVVREGEVEVIKGGMGAMNQLWNTVRNLNNQGLTPDAVKAVKQVARATAMPVLERTLRQRDEFARSLDDVLGQDFPGLGRIVTGSGADWGNMKAVAAGSYGTGIVENPDGSRSKTVDFGDLVPEQDDNPYAGPIRR